jgi:hypothetical protein
VTGQPRTSPPRVSPVGDLPSEAVLAHTGELARRWASELILARAPADFGHVPVDAIAREAPALCAQLVGAVRSDLELERLTGSGDAGADPGSTAARRLLAVCGARDAGEAAAAVEVLRGVLWRALLENVGESPPRLLAQACDRLAHVCASTLASALDGGFAAQPYAPSGGAEAAIALSETTVRAGAPAPASGQRAVIVDELAGLPVQAPSQQASSPERSSPEIAIRDERSEGGPAAWIGSIGAQLESFARDELAFAVLLVEIVELEQLRREEPPDRLSRLANQVEQTLAGGLGGWSGTLTRERPGRCWLVAPDTDRAGARQLAERLAHAVASSVTNRGLALEVAIGTAVCPDEGRRAAALAAHADVGLYAARSSLRATAGRPAGPPPWSG